MLGAGDYTITASYSGDTNHLASTAPALSVRVVQPSAATLSSTANPAISGTPVTLIAKISPVNAVGSSKVPGGVVIFTDGTNALGTTTLDGSGTASLSTSTLTVGIHNVQVAFPGDVNFAVAGASLTQSITAASTQVTLSAATNPATFAAPLVLTASISSNGGVATGFVTFNDGQTGIGTAPLNAQGVAHLTLATLAPGAHTLTASYVGDGKASASASGPLNLVVKQMTTVALSSLSNPALTLSAIQFTVAIGNAGAAVATGTVSFIDGAIALGTASLDGSGHASLSVPKLSAGSHSITASYVGDDKNFGNYTLSALTETVQLRPTSTALTSSATNANDPQQVTLIALVHGDGSIPPGGTVTFLLGSALVGTSTVDGTGVATLTIKLETKQENVTASYGGDVSYNGSASTALSVAAGAATQFTLQVNPAIVTVARKEHTTVVITLQSVKGFIDTLKLGCLGLPFAATCTFSSPATQLASDGSATVQLTFDTGDPLGVGAQAAEVHGVLGRRVWLCLLPASLLFARKRSLRRPSRLTGLLLLFFAAALTVVVSGCSGLQVNGTPPGTYTFKVTASGMGTGATQSQTVTLTVTE